MRATIVPIACALALAGCATGERLEAAGDVHALLVAVRDDDKPAFEAHVDRPALEAQIQAALESRASRSDVRGDWRSLATLLAGPLAHGAGELLIQPQVLREVADYYGYRPGTPIPNVIVIAGALKPMPDGRVCAQRHKDARCLLTFAKEGDTWRLVAFDSEAAVARLSKGGS